MTFVIIGGGLPAWSWPGRSRRDLTPGAVPRFQHIDPTQARIGSDRDVPRVLPPLSGGSLRQAAPSSERAGGCRAGARSSRCRRRRRLLGAGRIRARTVIWAAGVAARPWPGLWGRPLDHAGRVVVDPTLAVLAVPTSRPSSATWRRSAETASRFPRRPGRDPDGPARRASRSGAPSPAAAASRSASPRRGLRDDRTRQKRWAKCWAASSSRETWPGSRGSRSHRLPDRLPDRCSCCSSGPTRTSRSVAARGCHRAFRHLLGSA